MSHDPDAPRLRAYLKYSRVDGCPVIWAKKLEWDGLGLTPGDSVELDLAEFEDSALGGVASNATVIAVTAQQLSTASGRLTVQRHDPEDAPLSLNVDHYGVWPDLRSHDSLGDWMKAASTGMNENMERFLDENMAFVKEPPGDDHRQALPPMLRARLDDVP